MPDPDAIPLSERRPKRRPDDRLRALKDEASEAFAEHLGIGARKRGLTTEEGVQRLREDARTIAYTAALEEYGLINNGDPILAGQTFDADSNGRLWGDRYY